MFTDIDYELNTLQGYDAEGMTEHINGVLDSLIVQSDKPTEVLLCFAEVPDVIVYHKMDFVGTYYMPLRITAVSKSGNQFNFVANPFSLNNKIYMRVRGQPETVVKITMRIQDRVESAPIIDGSEE